jgi:septal ring factor EnvC (AmiA/AmiB activator)
MQDASPDPTLRDMLTQLNESMRQSTHQLSESLGRYEAHNQEQRKRLEERQAKAKQRLEEAKKAREDVLAKLAARKAAKAAWPRRTEEAVDPHLGEKLRDKLLEEFGTRVDARPSNWPGSPGSLLDFEPGA